MEPLNICDIALTKENKNNSQNYDSKRKKNETETETPIYFIRIFFLDNDIKNC